MALLAQRSKQPQPAEETMKYRDYVAQMRVDAEGYRTRGFPNRAAYALAKADKAEDALRTAGLWSKKIGRYNLLGKIHVEPVTVADLVRHGIDAKEAQAFLAI
jgi:hypothetical protein